MKVPRIFQLKRTKRFNATTVARRPPVIDEYDEPQTKLSSAFIVVLVLHLVAVGGIYAFNSIKANRKPVEQASAQTIVQTTPPTVTQPAMHATQPPALRPGASSAHPGETAGARTRPDNPDAAFAGSTESARSHSTPAVAKKPEDVKSSAAAKASGLKTYTVVKGDNPLAISKRLGVSYEELLKINGIDDPKKLQIGQTLKIPAKKN